MTREEFSNIAKGMKAIYADPKFIADKDAFDMWFSLLGNTPYEVMSMAVQAHMLSNKFPPTPADINLQIQKLREGNTSSLPSPETAWALVRKACRNANYHAEDEFAKLPEMVQQAVGSHENLSSWALLGIDVFESVQKSHFIKAYNGLVERAREEERLPDSIRRTIEAARYPQIEG